VLIHQHGQVDDARLRDTIRRVFHHRATHPIPGRLPPPPRELGVSYSRAAESVGVPKAPDEAHRILADWLDPILVEASAEDG
jgi:hypothetical protein